MDRTTFDFKECYINWLKEKIDQYQINNTTYRITMPFLDRNNDRIEFYIVLESPGKYQLTDDGSTLNELELSGFDIFTSKRRESIFESIINAHGVRCSKDGALYINCDDCDLPQKKHLLAQCVVKVSDLFYLSKPSVKSLFLEDVQGFLLDNDISYTTDVSFFGKSKLSIRYDFVIGRTKLSPSRVINAINHLDPSQAKLNAFNWTDTQEARKEEMIFYTFIRDSERQPSQSAITTLKEYGIHPVLWSQRYNYIEALAS